MFYSDEIIYTITDFKKDSLAHWGGSAHLQERGSHSSASLGGSMPDYWRREYIS